MPRGDRTGPMGTGAMTGRAAGYCAGFGVPGYLNPIPGRGFGRWGGRGRGWRHRYYATGLPGWVWAGWGYGLPAYGPLQQAQPSAEHELEALRAQAEFLESELGGLRKRMEELEAKKGGSEE